MANTLTGLLPAIYEAIDVVSRENVGFINAATKNVDATRAAVGQTITVPVAPAAGLIDNTPAVTPPVVSGQTIAPTSFTITKSKSAPITWSGEEQRGGVNAGWYQKTLVNQFTQGFRAIANAVDADIYAAALAGASRAYGTAGTTPFGTAGDLSDIAQVAKILDDNGAPNYDRAVVLNNAATANLRGKQSLLLKVNEAGSDALLRRGSISDLPLEGFGLYQSNQASSFTKGTGASYVLDGAHAVGATSITVKTGSGTIKAGDIITIGSDTNKYVVNSGVSAAGTITIGAPGLLVAGADGGTVTIGNSYTPSVAFSASAIQLVARPPAVPVDINGKPMDAAEDAILITDPVSGLVYEVSMYKQFKQVSYFVGLAWGAAAIKPAHTALLLG